MVNEKRRKTSLSKSIIQNTELGENSENSEEESVYLPLKYPQDQKYYEFLKNFEIGSQDQREAESSLTHTSEKKHTNSQNCAKCSLKFNKKLFFIGCFKCYQWFCLNCSLLTKKEASDLKKNKKEWKCLNCSKNPNANIDFKKLEEENAFLKKHIVEMYNKIEYLIKKVENIETFQVTNKISQIEILIKKMFEIFEEKNIYQPKNDKSYSAALKSSKNDTTEKENLPVVIIKPKNNQNSKQTKEYVQKNVNPSSIKATVKEVKEIRNGGIIIKTNTKEEVQRLKEISEEKLNKNYTVEISKMKLPRLALIGSRKKYEKEELLDELKTLGYLDENDTLNIKYTRQSKHTKKFIIYMECNGKCFKKLVNQEVYLGWDKCVIKEDYNILVCYKCYSYGHKTVQCNKNQICSFCAGNHIFWKCQERNPRCSNCKIYNEKYKTNMSYNHETLTSKCPIHEKKIKEIKKKINYSDQ